MNTVKIMRSQKLVKLNALLKNINAVIVESIMNMEPLRNPVKMEILLDGSTLEYFK